MNPYPVGVFPYILQPHNLYWRFAEPAPLPMKPLSKVEVELRSFMRLLWEQHITWTRLTIVSLTFHLPDANVVVARLLQNATDMGNSLRLFYGDQAAETYESI